MYGAADVHETVVTKDKRTRFEWAMTQGALDRDMPLLGICGGQQLLHVVLGGKLIQHIPDSYENCLAHEQPIRVMKRAIRCKSNREPAS